MDMEIGAFIPVKKRSTRIPNKNFREFNGYPLYEHFFRKLHPTNPFDEVYVNTDSEEVKKTARSYGFSVIERPPRLSEDDANGNDLLLYDAEQADLDIYFQLFVTAPLLKQKTIHEAYSRMVSNNDADSLLTVQKHNSFFWDGDSPINYDPTELPRTQDLNPLIEETTGLYAIERDSLIERECRIGYDPEFVEVSQVEAIDIDEMTDLELARMIDSRTNNKDNSDKTDYDLLDRGY